MDRLNELKELTNSVLQNLKVNRDLQKETLKKAQQRSSQRIWIRRLISVSASIATVSLGVILFHHVFSIQEAIVQPPDQPDMEVYTPIESFPPLLPFYLPDNFKLQESKSVEDDSGLKENSVTFNGGDDYYTVTQSNQPLPYDAGKSQSIDLQGTPGYYTETEQGEMILVWSLGSLYYRLEGTISKSEAFKIANSIPK